MKSIASALYYLFCFSCSSVAPFARSTYTPTKIKKTLNKLRIRWKWSQILRVYSHLLNSLPGFVPRKIFLCVSCMLFGGVHYEKSFRIRPPCKFGHVPKLWTVFLQVRIHTWTNYSGCLLLFYAPADLIKAFRYSTPCLFIWREFSPREIFSKLTNSDFANVWVSSSLQGHRESNKKMRGVVGPIIEV